VGGGVAAIATEGGHAAFAPGDAVEIEVLRLLGRRFGRVSIERILAGSGMANLRWALGRAAGGEPPELAPEEIVRRAQAGGDALCSETLARFCGIYGSVAGDFALTYGARGGVFLGGGIAPGILEPLRASEFRKRFEAKGRFTGYMAAIPTRVITHPYATLLGAAMAAPIAAMR
ncbi:MAG: glucokinase, partial [Caulobacterales bacterium]